jgi:hypothetical protein
MTSTTQERAWACFESAVTDDDDHGYPDHVAFVPGDEEWADGVVWAHLSEGRPTVIVSDQTEMLLVPAPRSLRDRLAGQVRVVVKQRAHGFVGPYATSSTLGHYPVQQMRKLALS